MNFVVDTLSSCIITGQLVLSHATLYLTQRRQLETPPEIQPRILFPQNLFQPAQHLLLGHPSRQPFLLQAWVR